MSVDRLPAVATCNVRDDWNSDSSNMVEKTFHPVAFLYSSFVPSGTISLASGETLVKVVASMVGGVRHFTLHTFALKLPNAE